MTTGAMTSVVVQASLMLMPVTCCVLQMTPVLTGHLKRTKNASSRILMLAKEMRVIAFLVQSVTKVFGNFFFFRFLKGLIPRYRPISVHVHVHIKCMMHDDICECGDNLGRPLPLSRTEPLV